MRFFTLKQLIGPLLATVVFMTDHTKAGTDFPDDTINFITHCGSADDERRWRYALKLNGLDPVGIPPGKTVVIPVVRTAHDMGPAPVGGIVRLSIQDDTLVMTLEGASGGRPLVEGGTWGGDHWELFFANQRAKPYRQLGISLTGAVAEVAVGEESWTSGYQLETENGTNGWITTLRLPLASLLPGLTATSTFYMNVLRCPSGEGEPAFWSPVFQGGYHCPERLGEVRLGQPTPQRPTPPAPAWRLSLDCDDVDAPVKLLFPGGKARAVALSFDDGLESDKRLIELLNKYGMKGTFHVPVSCQIPQDHIAQVYRGHEVAIHDGNGESAPADFVTQVTNAGHTLAMLTQNPVAGLAYVGGSFTDAGASALEQAGVLYARTIGTERWFCLQTNRFLMLSTSGHQHQALPLAEKFLAFPGKPACLSIWGHTYEFANESDWQRIENFCKLVGKKTDIWYASLLELVIYTKAALKLEVDATQRSIRNPTGTILFIEADGKKHSIAPGATWRE